MVTAFSDKTGFCTVILVCNKVLEVCFDIGRQQILAFFIHIEIHVDIICGNIRERVYSALFFFGIAFILSEYFPLRETKSVVGYGVEIDHERVLGCIRNDVDVIQIDIEGGLSGFRGSFLRSRHHPNADVPR